MADSPADELRAAAALMRKRAKEATPGPWERPLDIRHKNSVIAALPEDERGEWVGGVIPARFASHKGLLGRYAGQRERVGIVSAAIWSLGSFMRKRSGRDLDYIASMHPGVALAVADWLDSAAERDGQVMVLVREEWDAALNVARAYLGSDPR